MFWATQDGATRPTAVEIVASMQTLRLALLIVDHFAVN